MNPINGFQRIKSDRPGPFVFNPRFFLAG